MNRELLSHLPVVLAVARRSGFAAAARELGMSASNVSHAIRTVENQLGVPLFARTTRSVALTEAGSAFVAGATPALADVNALWEQLRARKTGASGLLRINSPRIALPWVLKPVLLEMSKRFPDVTVEIYFEDALADVVAEGFDAGIRLGSMVAEDMVTVRLAPQFKVLIVGAPDYLARAGSLQSIGDLKVHNCIQYRLQSAGGIYRWDLRAGDRELQVATSGSIMVNDVLHAIELALAGAGLCYTFEPLVRNHIENGSLIEVLPKASITEPGLSLYFPKRAALAPKLRAFIETIREFSKT